MRKGQNITGSASCFSLKRPMPAGKRQAMSASIELRFRYEQVDYVRAMRLHLSRRMRLRLDVTMAIVLGVVGASLLAVAGPSWPGLLASAGSVSFLGLIGLAHFVVPVLAYRQQPKLHDEYQLDFAAAGIHFKTASIDSTIEWKLYRELLSDEHTHLLLYGKNGFTAVPRRVFSGPEQDAAFVALVRAAMPAT
jgi:hypothetical protein